MCESNVYSTDQKKIMEDVISIRIDDDNIYLEDILGRSLNLKGKITEINLDKHAIFLEIE